MKTYKFLILIVATLLIIGCKSKKEIALSPQERSSAKAIYEKASKSIRKNPEKSRLLFKEIMQLFPNSVYAQKSKIGIADSYYKSKDTSSLFLAASEYQEYVSLYPNSPDAIYAKFQIGMCYLKQMKKPGRDQTNTFNTIKYFESMINIFPDVPEAEKARNHIATARQYLATHYFRIGLSNYRLKAFLGAISRFKHVVSDYPDFKENEKLFYFIGKSYFFIKDYETSLSFFQKIINSYPKSKYSNKAQGMIKKIQPLIKVKGDKK